MNYSAYVTFYHIQRISIYVCMYVYIYTYMYIFVYVHIYTHEAGEGHSVKLRGKKSL